MFINGLGTATPPRHYSQLECWEGFLQAEPFARLTPRSQGMLKKILCGNNGIEGRYLSLEAISDAFDITPDAVHQRFQRHAPLLASQAAQRALEDAGIRAEQIESLVVSTCTGYLCPGLSSYVAERLNLRPEVFGLDLVGHGCAAALPNLRAAESLIRANGYRNVLSVCVEVCSAAMYLDDDPGVLISACLFGDAAGAMLVSDRPDPRKRLIEWRACGSLLEPAQRDLLRFEQRGGMLRNILTKPVPQLAAQHAETVLGQVLARVELAKEQIKTWIWHTAGRDVLMALQKQMDLSHADIEWSRLALSEYGNVSSASVHVVMEKALRGQAPGGWWWLSSFGAGFCCHGALLQVE